MKLGFIAAAVLAGLSCAPSQASGQEWDGWYGGFSAGALTGSYHDEYDWTIKYQGFELGGFAGYRGQLNQMIWTLETGGELTFSDEPRGDQDNETNTGLVGRISTRGTIGFAVNRFLPYAGVGLGMGFQKADPNRAGFRSDTQTHLGLEILAGIDAAITEQAFVRTEVRYTAFSDASYNLGRGGFRAGMVGAVDAKIGVGLRF